MLLKLRRMIRASRGEINRAVKGPPPSEPPAQLLTPQPRRELDPERRIVGSDGLPIHAVNGAGERHDPISQRRLALLRFITLACLARLAGGFPSRRPPPPSQPRPWPSAKRP
jgi:hypothetical protein